MKKIQNVNFDKTKESVVILDQSLLPNKTVYLSLSSLPEMFDAIYTLKVRGAPAIGIFTAFGIAVLMKKHKNEDIDSFKDNFRKYKEKLFSARPTAVNLGWALSRMESVIEKNGTLSTSELSELLFDEAKAIQDEDIRMCESISALGLSLLKDGDGIITHCNAGPLATSLYGTGLGPILLGKEKGYEFKVFCDETRPLFQGARITAYELTNAGVDCTLICDNMASFVMKEGKINACLVGCDRVAANGDTANKIGTSGLAILAAHYGIPFYVLGPSSTVDFSCKSGDDIVVELRKEEEIKTKFFCSPIAKDDVKCLNPSFDVTDSRLITAIITEKGICRYPYTESLKILKG